MKIKLDNLQLATALKAITTVMLTQNVSVEKASYNVDYYPYRASLMRNDGIMNEDMAREVSKLTIYELLNIDDPEDEDDDPDLDEDEEAADVADEELRDALKKP